MRGKAGYRSRNFLTFRITPAYAGKSNCGCTGIDTKGDHPRLCGEKLSDDELFPNRQRITPAYAGKSRS